ncbi:unnamed protein product [Ectocarpus sp. CCAP 1310/34]|nr:unnamed protein product [Ectocarpus sp. CCAP 1310/34]
MVEHKAIKDKLEQGKGKGAKGAEQAYFADGEGRRERYSSRSQGQGRGRGGGRGRSSSRGRGGGGRGGRSGGSGGVEESKGSSSGGADGGGGGDYRFPGRCFRCGHRGHQAIGCTINEKDFVPWCARCEGWGHTKEKCATEEAVLAQVVDHESDVDSMEDQAFCAVAVPPANPTDLNEYHLAHGHAHETMLGITAEQQGVQLADGPLLPCRGCSMSKGQVKPVQKSTSTRALLPLADDEEGGEGESRADASRQGWGGERDSESESDLDVMEARGPGQATPIVREEAPTAPGNGIPGDGGNVPPSPTSRRGDFGGGSDSPTDSSSSS